ncbi:MULTISPECIES: hypothetical protein [unclassified Clostridium]|nr:MULTISPECIES: hypothetical protein [unclassified Clostridium]EKQ57624.1 MAG: hypothetical protein A370_00756 [Clostridium sp. Maddingley MBC34-26]
MAKKKKSELSKNDLASKEHHKLMSILAITSLMCPVFTLLHHFSINHAII